MESTIPKATLFNISKCVQNIFTKACNKSFPLKDFTAQVIWNNTGSSDLCSPSAMKIYNMNSKKEGWTLPSSKEVAQEILANIEDNELIGEIKITQQVTGVKKEVAPKKESENKNKKEKVEIPNFFIDINLKESWVETTVNNLLKNGIHLLSEEVQNRKVLVDFSSPNIAKEMHVGHLRSTILGDSICRILEFLGNDVRRINHVGDWGTQFGMLIAYLEETHPNYIEDKPDIKDLESFYVSAKKRFENEEFKKRAQEMTVKLQKGDPNCHLAWQFICDVSRCEFNKIYERLNIKIEEMGESFYDPLCRKVVADLEQKGVVVEDQGAKVLKLPGYKLPLMLVKSDGGLTYDTTDVAALNYRLNELNRDWVIYVIGSEQELHLKLLFEAGKLLGWHKPPQTRLDHMAFGLMLSAKGTKISTSDGGNVKLTTLLDEAKSRAKTELESRSLENKSNYSEEYIQNTAAKLGYSAVKYFDLKQFRSTQYKFDYNLMLDPKGNTAVYLFYNYVRICSIYSKAKYSDEDILKLIQNEKIKITHPKERLLLVHLIKFNDVIEDIFEDLAINKLCDYLYGVATKFSEFYEECKIVGDENMNSRLLIVELTRRMMKLSFDLLGLTPIEKI